MFRQRLDDGEHLIGKSLRHLAGLLAHLFQEGGRLCDIGRLGKSREFGG